MIERITGYHIHNDTNKAWNIIDNEISCVTNDIYIVGQNLSALGEIPIDVQLRLKTLIITAEKILDK